MNKTLNSKVKQIMLINNKILTNNNNNKYKFNSKQMKKTNLKKLILI